MMRLVSSMLKRGGSDRFGVDVSPELNGGRGLDAAIGSVAERVSPMPLNQVSTVFELAEDHALPLNVSLFNRAGAQSVECAVYVASCKDGQVCLNGPSWRARLDLSQVADVRVVRRCYPWCTRSAVECLDGDRRCLMSVVGPQADGSPEGVVWQRLLESLVA